MANAENETNTYSQCVGTRVGTMKSTRFERELARTPIEADVPDDHTPQSWQRARAVVACLEYEYPAELVDIWPVNGKPVLYFITSGVSGAIKIGISTRLRQRVTSLNTVVPHGLDEVWFCDMVAGHLRGSYTPYLSSIDLPENGSVTERESGRK